MTDLHSLLVNEAPIGIAALSAENTILFWNKKAEAIFGFTSEQAIGQSIHSLIVPPVFQEQSRKATDLALEKGASVYECISKGKEGNEFPVEIQLSRQMQDQQIILLCTMRLLPERKEKLNKKSVQETTEFLANMSHDLRTPLNSIVGFTEFLLEDQPGTLSTKQKEYLGDVLASGKQLLNLINVILDLAKIETGKISVVPEDFNVGTVLEQVLSIFAPVAKTNNVQLKSDVSRGCGAVTLDLHKFKQVLFNLFSNAIKFTGPGDCIETVIRKSTDENLEIVITTIRLRNYEQEAEGLDLLLTKKLLELQHGSLTVENASGLRTSFTVLLPAGYAVSANR
jgi:PAS domain S-box-containing protein